MPALSCMASQSMEGKTRLLRRAHGPCVWGRNSNGGVWRRTAVREPTVVLVVLYSVGTMMQTGIVVQRGRPASQGAAMVAEGTATAVKALTHAQQLSEHGAPYRHSQPSSTTARLLTSYPSKGQISVGLRRRNGFVLRPSKDVSPPAFVQILLTA